VVRISDGFGDADRNNDNAITFYDTDLNDSGTWNDPDPLKDGGLISRGITEVTAATDPTDVGIIWSGTRSYDTAANIVKARLRIINDDVPTGQETTTSIFHHGLALGVESRGSGSSFIGRFAQPVSLGTAAGDKLVVSVDFRTWLESANPNASNALLNELRWGLLRHGSRVRHECECGPEWRQRSLGQRRWNVVRITALRRMRQRHLR